jgi:hypothetical protein
LNFDDDGLLTSPEDPTDVAPVLRAYSRVSGVDHFNTYTANTAAKNISAINLPTDTVTTSTAHGLVVDDRVVIASVVGTTEINSGGQGYSNNGYVIASVPTTTTFTLKNLAGTAVAFGSWTPWVSGGTVTKALAHYGVRQPGVTDGRVAIYQHRYVPAANYATTGRFSGYHEFLAARPATTTPNEPEVALRIKDPGRSSGLTPLWMYLYDGSTTAERQVKTKAVGDLDSSDRVLYVDQAEAGVGATVPFVTIRSSNTGLTLDATDNGKMIYSPSNAGAITHELPSPFVTGTTIDFMTGGAGTVALHAATGQIRDGASQGTTITSDGGDGDFLRVRSASTAIWYVLDKKGTWVVS